MAWCRGVQILIMDLNFANALANAQSHTPTREDWQIGLNVNTSITQVMCMNLTPRAPITAEGNPLNYVEEVTYLVSLFSEDNSCSEISVSHFQALRPTGIPISTASNPRCSCITAMLSQSCWMSRNADNPWEPHEEDRQSIMGVSSRYTLFFGKKISPTETCMERQTVGMWCWQLNRWLGSVFWMDRDCIPKVAWSPPEKRTQ